MKETNNVPEQEQECNIVKEYFFNGSLRVEIPLINNMINGVIKEYYESGALKKEIPYKTVY